MKRIILTVVLLLAIAEHCRARIASMPSVEWLSCQSDVVVVGRITTISVTKGTYSVIYEDCTVVADEVIKGDIEAKELVFCLRTLSAQPSGKAFMNARDGVLFFLSYSTDHGSEHHLDHRLIPTSASYLLSIFDLSDLPNHLYSKEMAILTDPREVLVIARLWARSTIRYPIESEVPADSPIFGRLFGGSACYLTVPAEEKYRAHFLKLARSDDPRERREAASELYKFPGEETERVLHQLLKDETGSFWYSAADTVSTVRFDVREAAYHSLKALNQPVPDLELEREPTTEEQRLARQGYWRQSFARALSGGWTVISVEDGETRRGERRDTVAVIVTCGSGDRRGQFTLIPREWAEKDFPGGENLGINGRRSQGARHFFWDGDLPPETKEVLVKYFGLERF